MSDTAIYSFPAAIATRASNAELLTLAKSKGAVDPSIFDEVSPFFWNAEISSNRVDSYYTIMQPSTLKNYARALNDGVSFQNSHNTRELGLGYSLQGVFTGAQGNGLARVVGDFYTIPGVRLGAISTDDFIRGVRAGLVRDVSVGFRGGEYICSICGRDMMKDWKCNHFPGLSYETHDTTGKTPKIINQQCTAAIENAELGEVSAVFDGATPSAMIQRAAEAATSGRLTDRQHQLLEQRYRIQLPDKRIVSSGYSASGLSGTLTTTTTGSTSGTLVVKGDTTWTRTQPEDDEPFADPTLDDQVIEQPNEQINDPESDDAPIASSTNTTDDNTADSVLAPAGDGSTAVQTENTESNRSQSMSESLTTDRSVQLEKELNDALAQVRTATAEIERLKPLEPEVISLRSKVLELEPIAVDGRAYREDLIKDTIAEGVRAFGADFATETYTNLLNGVPLETVKRMQADWKKAGDSIFSGGRKTLDTAETGEKAEGETESGEKSKNGVSTAAYAG